MCRGVCMCVCRGVSRVLDRMEGSKSYTYLFIIIYIIMLCGDVAMWLVMLCGYVGNVMWLCGFNLVPRICH